MLGKDAIGKYDMVRYMLADRQYYAWQKQNYPKMYAWKDNSGGTVVPAFTNVKDQCYFNYGYRYSLSGGGYKAFPQRCHRSRPRGEYPSGHTWC